MAWLMLANTFYYCTDRVRIKSERLCKPRKEESLETLPASGVISAEYFLKAKPGATRDQQRLGGGNRLLRGAVPARETERIPGDAAIPGGAAEGPRQSQR